MAVRNDLDTQSLLQPRGAICQRRARLGVDRYEHSGGASVGREWIDFDNGDRPDFTQVRIAFGIHEGTDRAR